MKTSKALQYVSLEIVQDEDPMNPRNEFDNASTFYAVKNSRYMTGGKDDVEFSYRDDLESEIETMRKAGAVIHEFRTDAGTIYAVIDRDTIRKEWGKGPKAYRLARQCAAAEAETWENYCNGEVYGYIVTGPDGEHLDSCFGFYGEEYCREEGKQSATAHDLEFAQQEAEQQARLDAVTL